MPRAAATASTASRPAASAALLDELGQVCGRHGRDDLAVRLTELHGWVKSELRELETDLALVARGPRVVQRAAHHLLDLGGKHLRPMCVALASKVGGGFGAAARELAISVELVHTATLLHDDVVDNADVRRGQPAARALYGNAASIFAGDWLLVEALRRIRGAGVEGLLDKMLAVIEEMILAESLQLERRGRFSDTARIDDYLRVVEGKTAALFRWAMIAGARAGGVAPDQANALEKFGVHLGVAFQAVDDHLDFAGDVGMTGKTLFADLREGKLTYPLIVALDREPALGRVVAALVEHADESGALDAGACAEVASALARTGALAATRAMAEQRVELAIESLAPLAEGPAKRALVTVAEATLLREA
ncbi:MAG TPA: polyprenyl synthetase family protein [Kofleriaceae bacterium]|jgi:octaprenyl-diphosphate synthase|nr:polyprenyl synthetase family protein [Kofleriaceae bacterium]